MKKEDYLERARREVERARTRLPDYAGDCSDCRWRRGGFLSKVLLTGPTCGHPGVIAAAFNVTAAYDRAQFQFCDEQRDDEGIFGPVLCGPDGALFEAKS